MHENSPTTSPPASAQALLMKGALQNAILHSANFSIIATDEKGVIQLFNVGAERMLGYAAAEVINKVSPSDLHDSCEVKARAQALSLEQNTAIQPGFESLAFKASRGMDDVYDLTYICKDGSRFPANVSITALRDDQAVVIGYLLVGSDNSQRKKIEEELKKAVQAAERANQAKSDFLSGMSHELRTPLSAILGFAQLIETGNPPPTPSQKRSVDQILKAGWYLLQLINQILDLALVESGRMTLSAEAISLASVIQECEQMIEPQARKRGIVVQFPQLSIDYFVVADRTRVKQVLLNLLSNAIKYNRTDGIVSVYFLEVSPNRVRICVEDSGEGLSADKLELLFQPFNRLGQELQAQEGTGIGLVMTKRLIELMGGTVGVTSKVGTGSIFWFEMAITQERQHLPPNLDIVTDKVLPVPSSQAHTVLYVEDNPANMLLVEELIARRTDIKLLSARDGLTGVSMARAHLPDVILMDINLPGISGIEALKILTHDAHTAHIPVIALSANAIPRDIQKGLEAGFYRYLTKPINVHAFMEALQQALTYARVGQPLPTKEETTL